MVNPGEREKQETQRWQERFARGRVGLSVSVDEALADPASHIEDDMEEEAMLKSGKEQHVSGSMLIAPRLSLQSKPLPAVHVAQSAEIVVPPAAPPSTPSTGAVITPSKKKRLAGRNTRVELQAVPRQEKKTGKKTTPLSQKHVQAQDLPVHNVVVIEPAVQEHHSETPAAVHLQAAQAHEREKLSGSGICPQGRAEVTVKNAHVTLASVVLVSLLSDPGPVVVKYHTLLPGYGFTIHLSAPVEKETHFNYAILLGELL